VIPPPDIRPGRKPGQPAGPVLLFRLITRQLFGSRLRQNPAEFMLSAAQQYGDLVRYRIGNHTIYLLCHPQLITDFFGKDTPSHHRNLVMQRSRDVLGTGLLTSEEPLHMRQRRLAGPAFLRNRIAGYGDVIAGKTLGQVVKWQSGTIVEMHAQMMELALRIVSKCLFDLDEFDDLHAMESAVGSFMAFMPLAFLPFSRIVQASPLPSMRKLRRGQRYLDELIYRLIAERRADPTDRGDLLSMLLNATDDGADARSGEHAAAEQGSASTPRSVPANPVQTMSDQQLRDECVTVILAGHETTANALTFAVHLLARHGDVQQRLHDEAVRVLGPTRAPTAADYPALSYSTQVFAETMRLYPPVWITGRLCAQAYKIAGYTIPKGASIMAPQYAVHRDPRWWPNPDVFDPERFTEAAKATRPRNSYFPFGGGSRQCIAEGLAWMEGTLCLAIIARDWHLTPAPNTPAQPNLDPAISLRPKGGMPVRVDRR
jgi:cytochrome P450